MHRAEGDVWKPGDVPSYFSPSIVVKVLAGDVGQLDAAFVWDDTPEGTDHWYDIQRGGKPLTHDDVVQLLRWVAQHLEENP